MSTATVSGRARRHAAVALLVASLAVALPWLAPSPASAGVRTAPAGCPIATPLAHVKAARSVFTGTVDSVAVRENNPQDPDRRVFVFTHQVTISRVYKGAAEIFRGVGGTASDRIGVVTLRSSNRCSLGRLTVGQEYVFFTHDEQGTVIASFDSGTAPAAPGLVTGVENVLGPGRDPTPPPPATATFTRVSDSEPTTLTRLLAPGAALVIIGLLGLAVVGRLGRRG